MRQVVVWAENVADGWSPRGWWEGERKRRRKGHLPSRYPRLLFPPHSREKQAAKQRTTGSIARPFHSHCAPSFFLSSPSLPHLSTQGLCFFES